MCLYRKNCKAFPLLEVGLTKLVEKQLLFVVLQSASERKGVHRSREGRFCPHPANSKVEEEPFESNIAQHIFRLIVKYRPTAGARQQEAIDRIVRWPLQACVDAPLRTVSVVGPDYNVPFE